MCGARLPPGERIMTRILAALALSTLGTIRDEGHCLDKRALVLTEAEALDMEAEIKTLRRDLASTQREAAAALESQAQCLTAPMPVCDCSEWTHGLIGAGVGVLSCGTFWLGARL